MSVAEEKNSNENNNGFITNCINKREKKVLKDSYTNELNPSVAGDSQKFKTHFITCMRVDHTNALILRDDRHRDTSLTVD